MKVELLDLDKKVVGEVAIDDGVFGLETRPDLIKRVIDWQRSRSMSGTHQTKTISDVSGSTRKPFKQKGTGNARQGTIRAPHMRGGGKSHGPVTRSHATKLQKKVRKLGLKHALSDRFSDGAVFMVDSFKMNAPKTADAIKSFKNFGTGRFFVIDGSEVDVNFRKSIDNIPGVQIVPAIGANVYDIINSDFVLISKDGLSSLQERLK